MKNRDYQRQWDKDNSVCISFRLSKKKDNDLLIWFKDMEDKTSYIKSLVRADMKRRNIF